MEIKDTSSVSVKELAELFGTTSRTINERVVQGRYPKVSHGVYNLEDVLQAEFKYLKAAESNARNKLYHAQAETAELKAGELRGELGKTADFMSAVMEVYTIFSSALESYGRRLAGEFAGIKDPRIIRKRLDAESRNTRKRCADKIELMASPWVDRVESAKNIKTKAGKNPGTVGESK